jgi:hypothetical protein
MNPVRVFCRLCISFWSFPAFPSRECRKCETNIVHTTLFVRTELVRCPVNHSVQQCRWESCGYTLRADKHPGTGDEARPESTELAAAVASATATQPQRAIKSVQRPTHQLADTAAQLVRAWARRTRLRQYYSHI